MAAASAPSDPTLCNNNCGRKKGENGKFPTCCRTCRGPGSKHGPTCDAVNGVAQVGPFGSIVHPKPAVQLARTGASVRLFLSGHITNATFRAFGAAPATEANQVWLPATVWQAAEKKASTPPFNTKLGEYGSAVKSLNVPTYGPALTSALMSIFAHPELVSMAERLHVAIPPMSLNRVIVAKMAKVEQLVRFFEQPKEVTGIDLSSEDKGGLKKLDEYCKMVQSLDAGTTAAQWHAKVDKCLGHHRWTTVLTLETLLQNFGFSPESSKSICDSTVGQPQKWGQFSLRWVSKSFDVIGVEGALSDVVNVIFAMKNIDEATGNHMNIGQIEGVVTSFRDEHVFGKSATGLWMPTHVAHDAELDDALAIVLLQHMVQVTGAEPLQVLVQLPAFTMFQTAVAPKLQITDAGLGTSTILYDPDSRNPGPIAAYWTGPSGHA